MPPALRIAQVVPMAMSRRSFLYLNKSEFVLGSGLEPHFIAQAPLLPLKGNSPFSCFMGHEAQSKGREGALLAEGFGLKSWDPQALSRCLQGCLKCPIDQASGSRREDPTRCVSIIRFCLSQNDSPSSETQPHICKELLGPSQ